MTKQRLYLETTIPSYLTSRPSRDLIIAGHQQITKEWCEKRKGGFQIYISQLVIDEARAGDLAIAAVHGLDFLLNLELRAHRKCSHCQSRSENLQAARFRMSGHLHAGGVVLGE